jgi:hypothetical protein
VQAPCLPLRARTTRGTVITRTADAVQCASSLRAHAWIRQNDVQVGSSPTHVRTQRPAAAVPGNALAAATAAQPDLTLEAEALARKVHVFGLTHTSNVPAIGG